MPARQLPDRPSLDQYKKQAKELLNAWKAGDEAAIARVREYHPRLVKDPDADLRRQPTLADAQVVIAREHGFESWTTFVRRIEELTGQRSPDRIWRAASEAVARGDDAALDVLLRDHGGTLRNARPQSGVWWGDCSQGDARTIIAREHFFDSWDRFSAFREAVRGPSSPITRFEAAVDAIISGDIATLERALREHPELVHARSVRTHHATLLHYVGANGVEGFRQRTPKNAVAVADVLLNAGADVNAMADMYGGSDTLGLVATSVHPVTAGVQEALMEFLLTRGALLATASGGAASAGIVNACLANGRPGAADYLASRGAHLDLEAAAGIGRGDLVQRFFTPEGSLTGGATPQQMKDGFSWACEYGRTDVVEFLLQKGMDVGAKLRPHGQTGLHWASYGGHAGTVRLLLQHDAPVDVKDDTFETTPISWALYAWSGGREHWAGDGYYAIVEQLLRAGAKLEDEWLKQLRNEAHASLLAKKIREDARMLAILIDTR